MRVFGSLRRKNTKGSDPFPLEDGSDPNPQRAAVAVAFDLLLSLPWLTRTEIVGGRAGGKDGGRREYVLVGLAAASMLA
ncbi:hypothetical protein N5J29_16265, partial [Stenotrophomonas sp. GD03680]|uniref:hypothetical protein n=1 Tax=Stenotrophomonas sp. GD03680 TaxID=2975365 RepID=UPI00244990F6